MKMLILPARSASATARRFIFATTTTSRSTAPKTTTSTVSFRLRPRSCFSRPTDSLFSSRFIYFLFSAKISCFFPFLFQHFQHLLLLFLHPSLLGEQVYAADFGEHASGTARMIIIISISAHKKFHNSSSG